MRKRTTFVLLLMLGGLGCSSGKTYMFEVVVVNRTPSTLAAGLVKDGPPLEAKWDSPEQIAIGAPQFSEKHWGTPIPPGESRTLGPQKGTLESDTVPFVRVYSDDLTISELCAINRESGDRVSMPVPSGKVEIVVERQYGRLVIPAIPKHLDEPVK